MMPNPKAVEKNDQYVVEWVFNEYDDSAVSFDDFL